MRAAKPLIGLLRLSSSAKAWALRQRIYFVLIVMSIHFQSAFAAKLTIVSWGGAYEESQRRAYFEPYTRETGIEIEVERYNGGIEQLRKLVQSGDSRWDLIDLIIADNMQACSEGLLMPIDHAILPAAPDGTPAKDDFLTDGLTDCGVTQIVSSTVVAFNDSVFDGEKPESINDFFNIKKFPGKRALQKKPIAILEWALLSYGVPIDDLYSLLSTERGLRLAFERLNQIKSNIVWWEEGSEPIRLLTENQVVMSSGYNGRFFNAAVTLDAPIEIIWQGQLVNYSTWGIPKNAPDSNAALAFIKYATDTIRLTNQSKYIAYGPARASSRKRVRKHTESGVDVRPHLPTYPPNMAEAIMKDHQWYAKTQRRITQIFNDWITSH